MCHIRFLTPAPPVILGRSSKPFSPKCPDTPGSGLARHPSGDVGVPPAAFPVLSTGSLPPVPRVAVLYPATEPQHLLLSTSTPLTARLSTPHVRAHSDYYVAVKLPSDLRDSCTAAVWDEGRRSDIKSQVRAMFQTAAGGLPHLVFDQRVALTIGTFNPAASARWTFRVGWVHICSAGIFLSRRCVSPQ